MQQVDIALIGAGPIGLELAVSFKDAGVNYIHFDAGQVGQTISWYPRQARFFSSPDRISICGVPLKNADESKTSREEYLAYLRGIVEQFDLPIHYYERVDAIIKKTNGFELTTTVRSEVKQYLAQKVVFAIGDMHRPRMLNIKGEKLEHVNHYFVEPHRYFNQKLLIVGGKNSAAEAALRCHRAGAKVSISYRRNKFDDKSIKYWIKPELDWLIKQKQIAFYPQTIPTQITNSQVLLQDTNTNTGVGKTQAVDADFVLLLVGYEMDTSLLEMAGVLLCGDNQGPTYDFDTMQTNIAGLFVAGTAAAGTQKRFRLFIENCHPHVVKICRALQLPDPTHINQLAYQRLNEKPVADDMKSEQ